MRTVIYYAAIIGAFIVVWMLGTFLCAWFNTGGTFLMIVIIGAAIGAAKLVGALLIDYKKAGRNEPKIGQDSI